MLIERAFYHLPEVLHGSGYQQQEYEAGIVGAFSMALLQELNGRNISNPISCLQNERRFRTDGVYPHVVAARHLRADLFVHVQRLYTATRRLSQYGWRHFNWIEAKFLRNQAGAANQHCFNKTNYVAGHLADLIRLATLVPERDPLASSSGRYFLHAYDAPPQFYLTNRSREWCRAITQGGAQQLTLTNSNQEKPSILALLGNIPDLTINVNITNFVAQPSDYSHLPCCWLFLTRFDQVTLTLGQHMFAISNTRLIQASSPDALDRIDAFVVERIHTPPPEQQAPPPVDPPEPPEVLPDGQAQAPQ